MYCCGTWNPTWSFYWRALTCFSDQYQIVIPDHIGCGLSEEPQNWTYQLADHVQNLCDLLLSLNLTKIHLVVHDWGGAIGMGFATRYPEKNSFFDHNKTRLPFALKKSHCP